MGKLAISGGSKVRERPFVSHAIIEEEERKRVNEVLDSGMLSGFIANAGEHFLGGKQVKEFETLAKDYFKTKFAVAVNSATAGLHAALGACGVGPGDEVIVTPYTMSASATAIIMMNAVPVFADVEEETFCLEPQKVKEKITPKTKAIVIVHLFGHAANMDAIMKIAEEHKLSVIEDCAQSPGAAYKGKLVGTIGDIGVFSLNQHKTITSGEGGFAITNDEKLGLKMQLIRNHGEVIVDNMEVENIDGIVGFNYRMTELEAAVSIGQFRRLDSLNDHRIKLAEYLTEKLSNFEGLILPRKSNVDRHVYFVYPIRFKEDVIGVDRNTFVNALKAEGIPFGAGYVRPIYLEPMYQRKTAYGVNGCPFTCGYYGGEVNYSKGICPVCERMHEKELMLTGVCKSPHTKEDIDDVVKAFEKVFQNIDELKSIEK
ncbi:MAG: DegT/DnrJ/EryC1/StrS family aminotransferase [Candidatus Aureabacteria bacterium]|nr:DegT/DnrJ/EryC1/StrS family aminotransferase [Candidatus Auribacterota bacterium]